MKIDLLLKLASTFEKFAKGKYDHIDFKPPESVAKAAARGLELRKKNKGKGGLNVQQAAKQGIGSGVARAASLKNRQTLSPATVKRMKAFFDRHEKSAKVDAGKTPGKDKGYIAWMLWGGNPGRSWANKICRQMEAADKKGKGKRKVASVTGQSTDLNDIQNYYINAIKSAKDQAALDKAHESALHHIKRQEAKVPGSSKSFKNTVNIAYADRLNELLDKKNKVAFLLKKKFFKLAEKSNNIKPTPTTQGEKVWFSRFEKATTKNELDSLLRGRFYHLDEQKKSGGKSNYDFYKQRSRQMYDWKMNQINPEPSEPKSPAPSGPEPVRPTPPIPIDISPTPSAPPSAPSASAPPSAPPASAPPPAPPAIQRPQDVPLSPTQLKKIEELRNPGYNLGPFDKAAEYAKESLLQLPPNKRDGAIAAVDKEAHERFGMFNQPTDQKIIDLIDDLKRNPKFST